MKKKLLAERDFWAKRYQEKRMEVGRMRSFFYPLPQMDSDDSDCSYDNDDSLIRADIRLYQRLWRWECKKASHKMLRPKPRARPP